MAMLPLRGSVAIVVGSEGCGLVFGVLSPFSTNAQEIAARSAAKHIEIKNFAKQREKALVAWQGQAEHLPGSVQAMRDMPLWASESGMEAEPDGCRAGPLDCFVLKCRGRDMAERFLGLANKATKALLVEDWTRRHTKYVHEDMPPLGKVPAAKVSECVSAGMCICNRPTLKLFCAALLACLRKECPAKSPLRQLLASGMLVLRLSVPDVPESGRWLHPSFVNLVTFKASVMTLEEDDDPFRLLFADSDQAVPLKLAYPNRAALGAGSWWQALDSSEGFLQQPWKLTFYTLSASRVAVAAFVPGNIVVQRIRSSIGFWDGPPLPKERGGMGRRAPPPHALGLDPGEAGEGGMGENVGPLDDGDGGMADDGDGGGQDADDDAHGDAPGEEEEGEEEAEEEWQADLGAVILAAEAMGFVDFDGVDNGGEVGLIPDDGDLDFPFDEEEPEVLAPVAAAVGHLDGEPPLPAAPPADAVPPGGGVGDMLIGDHIPRNARRADFPQAVHSSLNGYLKLSQPVGAAHQDAFDSQNRC